MIKEANSSNSDSSSSNTIYSNKFIYMKYIFLGVSTILCLVFIVTVFLICVKVSFIKSLYWLATLAVMFPCVIGTWYLTESYLIFKNYSIIDCGMPIEQLNCNSSLERNSSYGPFYVDQKERKQTIKTIFFEHVNSSKSKVIPNKFISKSSSSIIRLAHNLILKGKVHDGSNKNNKQRTNMNMNKNKNFLKKKEKLITKYTIKVHRKIHTSKKNDIYNRYNMYP